MTFLPAPPPYPLRVEDEREAIRRLTIDVARVRHMLTKEYGLERLETLIVEGLRAGRLSLAEKAVEAASKGDRIADRALRGVGAELQMALLQKRDLEPGHLQVIAYLQRAYPSVLCHRSADHVSGRRLALLRAWDVRGTGNHDSQRRLQRGFLGPPDKRSPSRLGYRAFCLFTIAGLPRLLSPHLPDTLRASAGSRIPLAKPGHAALRDVCA